MNFADVNGDGVIASAFDFDSNTMEVRKSGRHVFYASDNYDSGVCSTCVGVKNDYETETYGERCFVLNRDYSGETNETGEANASMKI